MCALVLRSGSFSSSPARRSSSSLQPGSNHRRKYEDGEQGRGYVEEKELKSMPLSASAREEEFPPLEEVVDEIIYRIRQSSTAGDHVWQTSAFRPQTIDTEADEYGVLLQWLQTWKRQSQTESENRIHWLSGRKMRLRRKILAMLRSHSLQDSLVRNHFISRVKEGDAGFMLDCVDYFSKLEAERDLRLAKNVKQINSLHVLMSSAETCGYLSQMAKHIERETQGRVRLNRIERDDSMFSRCSSAIFGSVVNQVDPSREEARDMKITNVYQIENIILREIFQQSVDEICRERNIDMSKSMFKGLFLHCNLPDVGKVCITGTQFGDEDVLSAVLPVKMDAILPDYISDMVVDGGFVDDLFDSPPEIGEIVPLRRNSINLNENFRTGDFVYFFLCKVFLGLTDTCQTVDEESVRVKLSAVDSVFEQSSQTYYIQQQSLVLPEFLIQVQIVAADRAVEFPIDNHDALVIPFTAPLSKELSWVIPERFDRSGSTQRRIHKSFADLWNSVVSSAYPGLDSMKDHHSDHPEDRILPEINLGVLNLPFNPNALLEEKRTILARVQNRFLNQSEEFRSMIQMIASRQVEYAQEAVGTTRSLLESRQKVLREEKKRSLEIGRLIQKKRLRERRAHKLPSDK